MPAEAAGTGLIAFHRAAVGDPGEVHIDRAGCAWLIRRFINPAAEFGFVTDDPADSPAGATPFDMRGAELGHHGRDCSSKPSCGATS